MSLPLTQSLEERLRADITTRTSDVPVFMTAFERGHTSHNPKVIFQQPVSRSLGPRSQIAVPHVHPIALGAPSVLRGDPGSGQTPGFPHSTEEKRRHRLYEDPELITFRRHTTRLVEHLQTLRDLPRTQKQEVSLPFAVAQDDL